MQSKRKGRPPQPTGAGGAKSLQDLIAPRLMGLGVVIFLICIFGTIFASVFAPNQMAAFSAQWQGIPIKQTRAITGDVGRFNPVASLAEARAFAGQDARLVSMRAAYVRADGTMDLNATYTPAPQTVYQFAIEVPRPADAPPVGAGGANKGPWYQPVTINAYQPGRSSYISYTGAKGRLSSTLINDGFSREADDPTTQLAGPLEDDPACDLAAFWRTAIQTRGAPADAVATIEYKSNAYSFNISGPGISLKFDQGCNLTRP